MNSYIRGGASPNKSLTLIDLRILAKLYEGPSWGNRLSFELNLAGGLVRPALLGLKKEGLAEGEPELALYADAPKRHRVIYRITDLGRTKFEVAREGLKRELRL